MPRSIRLATAAMLGVVAILASACGSNSTKASSSSPTTTGSSSSGGNSTSKDPSSGSDGFLPVPAGTVLNFGDQEQSYETLFKASGVLSKLPFKVNFVQFASGPLVTAGFASKRLDAGEMGDLPAALTVSSKLPVRAVAISTSVGSAPSEFLLAKPGITSLSQLRGKPVAYTTGTQEQTFALRALAQAGLKQSDVHQADVTLEQLFTVLESGSVDASVVGLNDELIYLKSHPSAKALATNLTVKPPIYGYVLATTTALGNPAKKAAIEDFVKALLIAHDWEYTHKDAWATAYDVNVEHETPAEAKLGVNSSVNSVYVPYSTKVSSALQDVVKLDNQAGAIKNDFQVSPLYSDTSWWPTYTKILKEVHQDAP